MAEAPDSARGQYGETVKWILAIASGAIGAGFLHINEIEAQAVWVQGLLALSFIAFVLSVWSGMYYLLWVTTVPVVRQTLGEYKAAIQELRDPNGSDAEKKAELESKIKIEEKKVSDAKDAMPGWHKFYTYAFSAALACSALALLSGLVNHALAKGHSVDDGCKKDVADHGGSQTPQHFTHYSMVYSAVHRTAMGHREAHTFLMNDETGELWQMVCDGTKRVVFQKVPRIERSGP